MWGFRSTSAVWTKRKVFRTALVLWGVCYLIQIPRMEEITCMMGNFTSSLCGRATSNPPDVGSSGRVPKSVSTRSDSVNRAKGRPTLPPIKKPQATRGNGKKLGWKNNTERRCCKSWYGPPRDFMHAHFVHADACATHLPDYWPPIRENNCNMTKRFSSGLRFISLEFGLVNLLMKRTKCCIIVTVACWNPP